MGADNFYIGEIDAENDQLLDQAFIKTKNYDGVMEPRVYLVVGRKGVGKTALLKTISKRERDDFAYILTLKPEDVNPEQLKLLEQYSKSIEGFPQSQFLVNMWKTFIWATLMCEIGQTTRNKLAYDPKVAKIYRYVTNNKWVSPDFLTNFVSYAMTVLEEVQRRIKNKSAAQTIALLTSFPFGDPDYRNALEVTREHIRQKRALVLIDFVDEMEIGEQQGDPRMRNFYECLVNATKSIYNDEANDGGLAIKLALSSDIFYDLRLKQFDKVQGHAYEIEWDKEGLKDFIVSRLPLSPTSPKRLRSATPDECWAQYFDDSQRIQVDHDWRLNLTSFDYIYHHCFRRPRDLMFACQDINGLKGVPLGQRIATADEVKKGVKKHCANATSRLGREYYARLPNYESILGEFYDCSKVMSASDFKSKIKDGSPEVLTDAELDEICEEMYEMTAVGASYDKELTAVYFSKPPTGVDFAYKDVQANVMRGCKTVIFHPVLAEALRMYRGRRTPPKKTRKRGRM